MELSVPAFIGIFLSGLALNLTPCVYPMLSVTIALFGAHSPDGKSSQAPDIRRTFPRAFLYVLGMTVTYSSLGVFAAATGKLFGAAIQSPWILGLMALAMFVLSLSMFGLYEFQVPAFVIRRVSGGRRTGNVGVFLSGLLVGIFAAPCIGPPIVALLTLVGQLSNPFSGFLVFFVLSLGLGFPYLIIGTFSGLLGKLPKSGEWLVWIKELFGFALLGLAFFYFAAAFDSGLIPFVFPLTAVVAALYLGFLDRTGDASTSFRRLKRALGVLVLIAVALTFAHPKGRVEWEPYSIQKLELAQKLEKPVVIDFFADWCIPCHELEHFTYSDSNVIRSLEPFVRLKVDATHPDKLEASEPIERFHVVGVPTIVFLDPTGREVTQARITGYLPPEKFLESVNLIPLSAEDA